MLTEGRGREAIGSWRSALLSRRPAAVLFCPSKGAGSLMAVAAIDPGHREVDHGTEGQKSAENRQHRPKARGTGAQPAGQIRTGEAAEIADRIDQRDAGGRGGGTENSRRQGPEHGI